MFRVRIHCGLGRISAKHTAEKLDAKDGGYKMIARALLVGVGGYMVIVLMGTAGMRDQGGRLKRIACHLMVLLVCCGIALGAMLLSGQ